MKMWTKLESVDVAHPLPFDQHRSIHIADFLSCFPLLAFWVGTLCFKEGKKKKKTRKGKFGHK